MESQERPSTLTHRDQLREAAAAKARQFVEELVAEVGGTAVTSLQSRFDLWPGVRTAESEPLACVEAARELEHAAHLIQRDYIRQAREAGSSCTRSARHWTCSGMPSSATSPWPTKPTTTRSATTGPQQRSRPTLGPAKPAMSAGRSAGHTEMVFHSSLDHPISNHKTEVGGVPRTFLFIGQPGSNWHRKSRRYSLERWTTSKHSRPHRANRLEGVACTAR